MEICFSSVAELSQGLGAGLISPVEVTDALLDRVNRLNDTLCSYITVCEEEARSAARTAEEDLRTGRSRGLLHGIPIAHKDVIWTGGIRTTAHSRALVDFIPDMSATSVQRLANAGMILLGKTNTGEFACGTTDLFGTPRNPWSLTRYTGGSSNGSANAVAAGLAPAATGTDTGGSIRVPASLCGVVGLKPTYGRVSRHGIFPLSWSMDHVGVITRTAEDAALLLEVMAGHDPLDPSSSAEPVPVYSKEIQAPVQHLVAGIPREHFYQGLHADVATSIDFALELLERNGVRLINVSLPRASDLAYIGPMLYRIEAFAQHAARLRRQGRDYGRRARQKISEGAFFTSADYLQASQVRELWCHELNRAFQSIDVLITPTLPFPAFQLEMQESDPPDTSWGTRHFNLSGHPAVTVPCGFSAGGLPIGMQVIGRGFEESVILRVAHFYQQETEWHKRRPPIGGEGTSVSTARVVPG